MFFATDEFFVPFWLADDLIVAYGVACRSICFMLSCLWDEDFVRLLLFLEIFMDGELVVGLVFVDEALEWLLSLSEPNELGGLGGNTDAGLLLSFVDTAAVAAADAATLGVFWFGLFEVSWRIVLDVVDLLLLLTSTTRMGGEVLVETDCGPSVVDDFE